MAHRNCRVWSPNRVTINSSVAGRRPTRRELLFCESECNVAVAVSETWRLAPNAKFPLVCSQRTISRVIVKC